ncbi:MAG: hypothetical protein HOE90_12820 [Bacteriovoracaceae bacterium]|jgi:hypothetical protein|nr:hypothetical protein [Bacteriovoracaceae bacterium]
MRSLLLCLIALFFTLKSHAVYLPLEVKGFDFNLDTGGSQLSFEKLSYESAGLKFLVNPQTINLTRTGAVLGYKNSDLELEFELGKEFKTMTKLEASGLDILMELNKFSAVLDNLNWKSPSGSGFINTLNLSGVDNIAGKYPNAWENLLDAFTRNLVGSTPLIKFNKNVKIGNDRSGKAIEINQIKKAKLELSNNMLKFTGKASGSLTIGLKFEGQVSYNGLEKKLVIRLDKAKAGFISIKGFVFDSIKDMKNPQIEVSPPYIKMKIRN